MARHSQLIPTLLVSLTALALPSSAHGQAGYPQGQAVPPGYSYAQAQPGQAGGAPMYPGPPAQTQPGTCFDRVQNSAESDVDCGGDCTACEVGRSCSAWRDCWSGRCADGVCEERMLTPGDPIPPGYDVETSMTDGAATARYFGAGFLGVGYAAAYVGAVANPTELKWLYAPILGPWVALGQVESGKVWLAIDGVLQGAGGLVLLGGLIGSGKQLVRQPPKSAEAAAQHVTTWPYVGLGSLGVFGQF